MALVHEIVYLNIGDLFKWRDEDAVLEATTSNMEWRNSDSALADMNRGSIRGKEVRAPETLLEMVDGIQDYLYCTNQIEKVEK